MAYVTRTVARHCWIAVCGMVLIIAGSNLHAAAAPNPQPVIASAVPDLSGGLLFISGSDLPPEPFVTIGLSPAAIDRASASEIVAILPDLQPGTYLLTVQSSRKKNSAQFAVFAVTIGTAGPQGIEGTPGVQGIPGPMGPAGPPGASTAGRAVMCGFQQALQGILADGTPVCRPVNPDVIPPRATLVFPHEGFRCGEPEFIIVQFSELVDQSTVNNQTFRVRNLSTDLDVPGLITFENDVLGPVWRFVPQSPLPDMTVFGIIVAGVKDIEGNTMTVELHEVTAKFCGQG